MTALERPFRPVSLSSEPVASFAVNDLVAQLIEEPQYEGEGKTGLALVRDTDLTVVLEVLRKGSELREHRAPAPAMVILLSGRATFTSGDGAQQREMVPGSLVAFASHLDHALVAVEDSACLIAIGGHAGRRK